VGLKSTPIPVQVELPEEGKRLRLVWQDGTERTFAAFDLRVACPCAECVDELSGRRTLDPGKVDPEVRALEVGRVGRYALQIRWSDGHQTGIYAYEKLFEGTP
jgi:DUF971 family protein